MLLRLVNGGLLVAALVGAWLSIGEGRTYRQLLRQRSALAAEVGLIDVTDPDKFHVVALRTGEPLHFAWQIYVPANLKLAMETRGQGGGTSSMSGSGSEAEFHLVRVKFRKEGPGQWRVWFKWINGSGLLSVGNPGSALDDPSALVIEQLGLSGLAVVDPSEATTLLKIAGPSKQQGKPEDTLIFKMRFGQQGALQ